MNCAVSICRKANDRKNLARWLPLFLDATRQKVASDGMKSRGKHVNCIFIHIRLKKLFQSFTNSPRFLWTLCKALPGLSATSWKKEILDFSNFFSWLGRDWNLTHSYFIAIVSFFSLIPTFFLFLSVFTLIFSRCLPSFFFFLFSLLFSSYFLTFFMRETESLAND